uniref:MAT1-1-3b protein n=1 Tax=Pyricularia grisea TaxID=148305 RepID=Q2V2N8_PYRGI|nr:MAT1-1-3b [Pyricularia grisea]
MDYENSIVASQMPAERISVSVSIPQQTVDFEVPALWSLGKVCGIASELRLTLLAPQLARTWPAWFGSGSSAFLRSGTASRQLAGTPVGCWLAALILLLNLPPQRPHSHRHSTAVRKTQTQTSTPMVSMRTCCRLLSAAALDLPSLQTAGFSTVPPSQLSCGQTTRP